MYIFKTKITRSVSYTHLDVYKRQVLDPLRFLRQREIVHFQRFGEALRGVQDKLAEKRFFMNDTNMANMMSNNCNGCSDCNNNCGCN